MIKSRNKVTVIALIFATVYMVSYLTRINFAAIVSEIEHSTSISKSLLSLSLTGISVAYGIGQIINGITVDKVSPKRMISVGFMLAVIMNLTIPILKNPYAMIVVWCVNGFAQSMMWPPIVKMMSQLFNEEEYKSAALIVSWGSAVGTMVVYLLAPVVLVMLDWRWVFWICGAIGAIMLVLWQFFPYGDQKMVERKTTEKGKISVFCSPLIAGIMLAIVMQGMLRDGVTTWMPSFISETYQWSTASSILTSVILPVFSIICFHLSTRLYQKVFTNPLLCAGVFFALGTVSAGCLYFVTGNNAVVSVLMSAVLTGSMHGVNMMLISMLPPYFKRYGLTGTASGVLNSCTYVGSAISTYGVSVISESVGWKYTVLLWSVIALLGTIICLICVDDFKKKFV